MAKNDQRRRNNDSNPVNKGQQAQSTATIQSIPFMGHGNSG